MLETPSDNYSDSANETYTALQCTQQDGAGFHVFISFSYIIIMIISLVGNGIVAYLIQFRAKFKSVTNLFISNLSIGDILMTIYCVPFTFVSTLILENWPFGLEMCRTVSYFQAVSVFVSAYTLVAISIDRYMAIMHPFRPRMTHFHAKIAIGAVWLVALATALPIVFVSVLEQPENNCGRFVCSEDWTSPESHFAYSVILMVLQYGVPVTVLVYTYTRIAIVVWGKETPGEAENVRDARLASRKRKMIKMMVVVVIVYTVCWLPYNVLLLILMSENHEIRSWPGIKYLYFALHWLAMSHTCYNPAIYVYMNHRFKHGFLSVLWHLPCLRRWLPPVPDDSRGMSYALASAADPDSSLRRGLSCSTYVAPKKQGTFKSPVLVQRFSNDF